MTRVLPLLTLLFALQSLFLASTAQASANTLTYQGRILKADGKPLEYSAVSFIFQVTDPAGYCVLYQEQVTGVNMTNSSGVFDVAIGAGTISWPTGGSYNVTQAFNNSQTHTCGECSGYTCSASSSNYSPAVSDGRRLRVQFFDGNGWRTVSPDTIIRAVPYASFANSAQKLGTYNASDFVVKSDINNSGSGSVSCDAGKFLTWDAATLKFGCSAVVGASGGTVTDVTVGAPLSVVTSTSTPHITLPVASSGQSGYLSSSDWNTFNTKLGSSQNFSGDVSGTYNSLQVDGIKGRALAISSLTSGQILKYDGSQWINSLINTSDISGLSTALANKVDTSQFPASCDAGSTLTRLSPALNFSCTPIAIAGSQVSGNIAGKAAGFTGALSGDVTGTQESTTVARLRGVNISATAPSSNQVLQFDGTNWGPATLTIPGGTVTSVSATSPLVSSGGNTPTLSLGGLSGLGTANQILGMNSGATGYEYKTISGTTRRVTVSHSAGGISLSTPQDIDDTAAPVFAGLRLSGLGAGLVKTNSSGVLSSSGTVNASSEISGVLPVANGGTGSSSLGANSVIVSNGAGNLTGSIGPGVGSMLSTGAAGPEWTTARYPSSTVANQLLYSTTNNSVTGLATSNDAVLTTSSSGAPTWISKATDLFSQYILGAGRSGGQTLHGGVAANETLTIHSTANTTKGNIYLNPVGGNVGIGSHSAAEKLSVAGVVQSTTGGFKFPDGSVQTTAAAAGYGLASSSPALNCNDLHTVQPSLPTGVYWVKPTTSATPFQVFCDMTTDGGGWTLVWSNLRGGSGKPTYELNWAGAINTTPRYSGIPSADRESFIVYTGLKHWAGLAPLGQFRTDWSPNFAVATQQRVRCNYTLTTADYILTLSGCVQQLGSVTPGLMVLHNGKKFSALDVDNDNIGTACTSEYGHTPFWYEGCWSGSINGGGELPHVGYKNGAYWTGSVNSWGASDGSGAGNGWYYVR